MNWRLPIISPRVAGRLLAAGLTALGLAAFFGSGPPPHAPVPGANAGWRQRLAELRGATPEAAQRAETAAVAARADLETPDQFGERLRTWSPEWRAECRATEQRFGLEVRRYRLRSADPTPRAWSACLELLRSLAEQPGVTIEQLTLTAAPAGDGAFTQLAVDLTVRLKS
jgi:hypothetical protein